jgi:hypothetical protein
MSYLRYFALRARFCGALFALDVVVLPRDVSSERYAKSSSFVVSATKPRMPT